MNLSEQDKEDITDMVIDSRDVGEEKDDLTLAYLKGYSDCENKWKRALEGLIKGGGSYYG